MRAYPDQIASQLNRNIAPAYLVSGDEPLQLIEVSDAIRAAARKQGYADRLIFNIGTGFDWNVVRAEFNSLSLFAQRRVLELRLPAGKLDSEGADTVAEYCARPAPDTVLLVTAPKLEKSATNAKWQGALDGIGVTVQVWPVEAAQLPAWIERRMRARGLQADAEAVALLADRVEGNLLAAAQEIDKLALLYGTGKLGVEQVVAAVADSARFDVYTLADAALQGDSARVARIANGLRAEGEDPVLALWSLTRDVRALVAMARDAQNGAPLPAVLAKYRVWDKRKVPFEKALRRYNALRWQRVLQRCGRVDRVIKGREAGNAWDELLELAILMSGVVLVERRANVKP